MSNIDPVKLKEGLYLFKALIKDGCKWHGDVMSREWSECLYIEDEKTAERVEFTLSMYVGFIYKRDGMAIWIY